MNRRNFLKVSGITVVSLASLSSLSLAKKDEEITYHDDIDGSGRVTGFDKKGDLVYRRTPKGKETKYRYYPNGKCAIMTSQFEDKSILFQFDTKGYLIYTENSNGGASFTERDKRGKTVGSKYNYKGRPCSRDVFVKSIKPFTEKEYYDV